MKIKITKIVQPEIKEEQEIEIALPRFSKSDNQYYCIVGESKTIHVCLDSDIIYPMVRYWDDYNSKVEDALAATEITEEEFMLAYDTAKSLIETALNKSLLTI